MTSRYDRRLFLKGLGLGAGLLPLVGAESARAATAPRRLLVIFFPNGIIPEKFWPSGTETAFVPGEILKPLEPYRSKMLILGGLDLSCRLDDKSTDGSVTPGHDATASILTGRKLAVFKYQNYQAGGISIDQHIANELQKSSPTPIHSLVVGARAGGFSSLSWRGASDPVTYENDATKLFSRLFMNGVPSSEAALKQQAAERSILDFVGRDLGRFAQRLGGEDRQKVEAHLASLRDLESEIARRATPGAACTRPTIATAVKGAAGYPDDIKIKSDLIAAAFRCDLTRVVTLKWSWDSANGTIFPWLGTEFSGAVDETDEKGYIRDHHDMGHVAYTNETTLRRKARVDEWYYEMVRYTLDKLAATPEGNGSMLDNTAVVITNNMNDGSWHSVKAMPFVIIGSCGGYFKTGRWLKYASWTKYDSYSPAWYGNGTNRFSKSADRAPRGLPHNGLLVSLANAMGVPTASFGDAVYGSGELPGLRG